MYRFFVMTALAATIGWAAPAQAGISEDCVQNDDSNLKIRACTKVIESGKWKGANLSWAYNNRGLGYRRLGDLQRALVEYNESLRLKRDNVEALGNRAYVYDLLGQNDASIRDWERQLEYGGAKWVKRAQKYLKDRGFYRGAIDGKYGSGTQRALRACVPDPGC